METATSPGAGPDAAPTLDPNLTDPAAIRAALTASVTGQPLPDGAIVTPPQAEPAQPPAPAAPAPEPPPAQPPAGSTPPVEPTKPEDDEGRILPNRIPTRNLDTEGQRALALQHSLNNGKKPGEPGFVALAEAMRQVQAADNPPAASPAAAPQPTRLDALTTSVQGHEQKLTELQDQRAELAKEGTLYGGDIDAIQKQIDATVLALSEAKADLKLESRQVEHSEAERQRQAHEQAIQARESAKTKALDQYPSAGDQNAPLYSEILKMVSELNKPTHPDHGLLGTTNAALTITEKAAIAVAQRLSAEKGTSFAQEFEALQAPKAPAGSTPPGQAPAQPPVPPKVLPGMGRQQQVVQAPEKTPAQILADVGTDPLAARAALAARRGQSDIAVLRL